MVFSATYALDLLGGGDCVGKSRLSPELAFRAGGDAKPRSGQKPEKSKYVKKEPDLRQKRGPDGDAKQNKRHVHDQGELPNT